ncbi:hypothetical protein VNI00_008706 [Paramarasmius palmivorus]|uniref:RNA-dependent RNA polymerase n=1 Tax=Paramarasmius palmivorus TaxID=297713 RepID=A0AAW0CVB7_9AGAR
MSSAFLVTGLLASERASNFYYGGKIDFTARVDKEGLRIRLERAAKGPSNKAKRRFGSTGFLKIKIPTGTFKSQSDIERFFQRPFIMWSSVYRAILGKEDAVILFRTNERYVNGHLRTDPDNKSMSLYAFIHWFNPPEYNAEFFANGRHVWPFSGLHQCQGPNSSENISAFIGDEVSSEGSDMTDGCGFGNRSLFKAIQEKFGLEEMPCAVQCRIAGSKGMIVFSEDVEDDGSPQVRLRGSQRKVRYPPSLAKDPSHRIMDILRISRVRAPARLSVEVIVNLQHNGCPSSYFTNLLKSNLEDAVNPILAWDIENDPAAMIKLWHTIEQAEHVLVARRARQFVTESRFRGYSERVNEESLDDEDPLDEVNDDQHSTAWWPDPNSGCPSSIAETVMELLVAGFTPQSCAFMRDKISRLVMSQINRKCTKYNFDVKMSAGAFAVPDPYGVLREGEIYFKSSRRDFKTQEGTMTDVLEGAVLITRNPCKVPTDVQKFTAVLHPQLAHLVNCVVFSIKGARRPIDRLAGGDYDGDRVTVFYDPELVEGFKNADEKYSTEPPEVKTAFTLEHSLTVHQFNDQVLDISDLEVSVELQKSLLGGLRDPFLIGMYSFLHEKCVYVYGYAHPITIKTAYKFCAVMDGPKSGRRIVARVLSEDKGRFPIFQRLPWKHRIELMNSKLKDRSAGAGRTELLRRQVSSPFVMDTLSSEAEGLQRQWMAQTEAIFFENSHAICQTFSRGADKDLLAPWEFYRSKAVGRPELANDLRIIPTMLKTWLKSIRTSAQVDPLLNRR